MLPGLARFRPSHFEDFNQLGSGTFRIKGLDIPGVCPWIVILNSFTVVAIRGVSHSRRCIFIGAGFYVYLPLFN